MKSLNDFDAKMKALEKASNHSVLPSLFGEKGAAKRGYYNKPIWMNTKGWEREDLLDFLNEK